MVRKNLVSAVAVALFGSMSIGAMADVPETGVSSHWRWDNFIASTHFDDGIRILVGFPPESNCDITHFHLLGNDEIDKMSWKIDGNRFKTQEVTPRYIEDVGPAVGLVITKNALSSIKHGYSWVIYTDEGNLPVSLKGSAKALNSAYGNCMEEVGQKRLKATPANGPGIKKEVIQDLKDYNVIGVKI